MIADKENERDNVLTSSEDIEPAGKHTKRSVVRKVLPFAALVFVVALWGYARLQHQVLEASVEPAVHHFFPC